MNFPNSSEEAAIKLLEDAKLTDIIRNAVTEYDNEVKADSFPTDKHSSFIYESILVKLKFKQTPLCR